MSTIIMSVCWPLEGLTVAQKMVLISLADQANDDGICWPGIKSIGKRASLSERAVQDALAWLESVRLISKRFRPNSSTSYSVHPEQFDLSLAPPARRRKSAVSAGADGAPPADGAPGARNAPPPADGAPRGADGAPPPADGAPPGVQMAHPNRKGTVTEPSEEPPGEPPIAADLSAAAPVGSEAEIQDACRATWQSYRTAYADRYRVAPVRNAKVNKHVRDLVKRLGRTDAPLVAGFFLTINERYVVQNTHDLGVLLARAEGYRTQWATGQAMTETRARQSDRTESNRSAADEAMAILQSREVGHA